MKATFNVCIYQCLILLILLSAAIGCNKDDVDSIVNNKDYESVVDIDGNIYPAVEIGTQICRFVVNLR